MDDNYCRSASFFNLAINELASQKKPAKVKVLDLGCGSGKLVNLFLQLGYDAYGCDISADGHDPSDSAKLKLISLTPYRLPFNNNVFDVVVSTTVLEHVNNKEECFREIYRVLKPGGYSMHLYPGKWYLPSEPHMHVPLVNYFWPKCPKWWLQLWAMLGIRNVFQRNMSWKKVFESNLSYCQEGISYWPTSRYKELSLKIFDNCSWPMEFYLDHSGGGSARMLKHLPFRKLTGLLLRELRMGFLVHKKGYKI